MDANVQEAIAMYRLRKADDTYIELKRKCSLVLEEQPFANGGMRNAFKMRIVGDSNLYVAKEFQQHQPLQMYREEADVHQTAQELANLFNAQKPPKVVTFQNIWCSALAFGQSITLIFLIFIRVTHGHRMLLCEQFLDGNYQKHNCASGWLPKDPRQTPQAFSHFTFCVTKGQMLVVDLQGVEDTYTDPVVLTRNGQGFVFGNIGMYGIDDFLASHRCNPVCLQLGLAPVFGPLDCERPVTS